MQIRRIFVMEGFLSMLRRTERKKTGTSETDNIRKNDKWQKAREFHIIRNHDEYGIDSENMKSKSIKTNKLRNKSNKSNKNRIVTVGSIGDPSRKMNATAANE